MATDNYMKKNIWVKLSDVIPTDVPMDNREFVFCLPDGVRVLKTNAKGKLKSDKKYKYD